MGDELKWLQKAGGGRIFESCDISLEIRGVSIALAICAWTDSAMPLLSCACLHNNSSGACLPLRCFFVASVCLCAASLLLLA